jgi:2-polyprenyl-3-methyl-5-hydroxy-6-metoxy-1,4-benzoquinol methylase
MPSSNLAIAPALLALVDQAQPRSVLDVGPGYGKFGILLREYCHSIETLDACEAWPGYVTDRLRCLYDEVLECDVRELEQWALDRYDLIFMSEVIEHIDKDEGLALLARVRGHIVLSTPQEFFSNGPGLPPTETHRSLWDLSSFGDRIDADMSQLGGIVVRLKPLS